MAAKPLQDQPVKKAHRGAGKPFKPGASGNPAGRKAGSRNRFTALAERLMEDEAENVTRAVLAAAANGDMTAARLVLDRIAPVRRGRAIVLKLPKVDTAADVGRAMTTVIEAMGRGELSAEEASNVAAVLETRRRTIETTDHELRLRELEGNQQHDDEPRAPPSPTGATTTGRTTTQ